MKKKLRRGVTLLDVLLALGISAAMYANIAQMQNDARKNLIAVSSAGTMEALANASNAYITTNYRVLTTLTKGGPISIPIINQSNWEGIGDLQSTGLLSDDFTPVIAQGQIVNLVIRDIPASGTIPEHIEGMLISTGGTGFDDRQIGMAMEKMGGNGGGVMANPPPGVVQGNIQGSFASWSEPANEWSASGVTATTGHIAYNLAGSAGNPVAEWLNRYDTGNPVANTMFTAINFNNQNANNVQEIDGYGNNDIAIGDKTNHTGRVNINNGGMACVGDATGCHFDISDDGGFYDYNDGWITYQGNSSGEGIKLSGAGNNLVANGQIVGDNGLETSNTAGIQWEASPGVNQTASATATYASESGWLNIQGDSGFQGVASKLVKATEFVDANNNAYFVIPSGESRMDDIAMTGRLGVEGLDPDDGYPEGWQGGIHAHDVYSDSTIGAGQDGGVATFMSASGQIGTYANGCNTIVGAKGGCIYGDDTSLGLRVPSNQGTSGGSVSVTDQADNPAGLKAGALTAQGQVSEILDEATAGGYSGHAGQVSSINGDVSALNGNLNAWDVGNGQGSAFIEHNLIIGQNSNGTTEHASDADGEGPGGGLILRGNQELTGSIKFIFDPNDPAGPSGGFASPGEPCGPGHSTGPGSIGVDATQSKLSICQSDNTWHQLQTVEQK